MDKNNVFLGTSGWSYKEWIGPFYTKEDKSFLKAYTKVFSTVEIDSTFYRYPSKGTVMGWARHSPEGFVYSAKLPKLITHEKKLGLVADVKEDLEKFVELMEPLYLSGKLGCLLIQLPPSFSFKPEDLEGFFKELPSHVKFAVEFRNLSWMRPETWLLLEKFKIAYTIVDEPLLPPEVHFTSNIAYFRWHGKGTGPWFDYRYRAEELEPWVPKVKEAAGKVKTIFGYFNNHYHGYAPENCLQILQMLGKLTPQQAQAKTKVESHFKALTAFKDTTLEAFNGSRFTDLKELLLTFMDRGRLMRAESIRDDELAIKQATAQKVEAQIRDYHIRIDFDAKTISHDCEDWNKGLPARRVCKHLGKLFLSMEEKKALKLLKIICAQKEDWKFELYK